MAGNCPGPPRRPAPGLPGRLRFPPSLSGAWWEYPVGPYGPGREESKVSKRIDVAALEAVVGSLYPAPFGQPCTNRERRRLGDAAGLTQFGVNLMRLPPGSWSSQRHWHSHEDEFVYVLAGEVTLVTEAGTEILRAGDAAGFRAGDPDGHSLQNRSATDALVLEVGSRAPAQDVTTYPDIDLVAPAGRAPAIFTHRDGTPYPNVVRR
jgi:uncharacterized cupin superfamily protein